MNVKINQRFVSVSDAAKISGLSARWIRDKLKQGEVPHITSGPKVFVDIPVWFAHLDAQSANNAPNAAISQQ